MEDMQEKLEEIVEYIREKIVFILLALIGIILIILLIPTSKKENKTVPTLTLKGEVTYKINQGEIYSDPGYMAYDSKDGDITSRVIVEGVVNTDVPGKYTIVYKITNSSNNTIVATRIVEVKKVIKDVTITTNITPTTPTNEDVQIIIIMSGDYSFMIDPDGKTIEYDRYIYLAKENGVYDFQIKSKSGKVLTKEVEISNIDKEAPTGTCKNTLTKNHTKVEVVAKDNVGIVKYIYYSNDSKLNESEKATLDISKEYSNVSVELYDEVGNVQKIKCTEDNQIPVDPTPSNPTTPVTNDEHYNQTLKYAGLNYILYIPADLNTSRPVPLVIFLHGSGEFGSNINGVFNSKTAFVNGMRNRKWKGAVYLAPQCNNTKTKDWTSCMSALKELIDYIVKTKNIDTDRISITGHSMGGIAVYEMIERYPNFFSVGVPVAGRYRGSNVTALLNTKIRAYHGSEDTGVSYSLGKRSVEKIKARGGDAEFITLKGKYHAIQPDVYDNTDCLNWMIQQRRK